MAEGEANGSAGPTGHRIAITGPAGLLGRNLMFEIVRRWKDDLGNLELVLFGRGEAGGGDLRARIARIFDEDGRHYIGPHDAAALASFLDDRVHYVEADFTAPDLALSDEDCDRLRRLRIDTLYHIASVTDFRDNDRAREKLARANVDGTNALLSQMDRWQVGEFCYVSSAYVCGARGGRIAPDLIDMEAAFRNPYERSKLVAEIAAREWAARTGTKFRCFRPTTIGGRMIEPAFGTTHKFDVFYGFGHFLHRVKREAPAGTDLRLRIPCRLDSGLNIVPVDYAAKTMADVVANDLPGDSFHLAHEADLPHTQYIAETLEVVGYDAGEIVDTIPNDLSPLEGLFYQRVCSVLGPYTMGEPMAFDVGGLSPLRAAGAAPCPPLDRTAFGGLMRYAVAHNFGRAAA
jgi:nucleoside-diphosphate-sugar epimerase